MAKFTKKALSSGFAAVDDLEENFTNLETFSDNTLSRDGTTPNAMSADLDMGSNQIINLAGPTNASDGVNKAYGDANYGGAAATAAAASAAAAATSETNAATSETNAATSETNAASSETAAAASAATASSAATKVVEGRRQYDMYTATAGQTTFTTTAAFDAGYVDVFVNGSKINTDDYDDTSGTDIVFTEGLLAGDEVEIIQWGLLATVATSLLAANNLSDLDNVTTARTNLGLGDAALATIGTGVQAQDPQLQAIADSTPAANKVPLWAGATSYGFIDYLDEDTLSSDSATAVASQQSIKAYVDSQVASAQTLGDGQTWQDVIGSRILNTIYTNNTGRTIVVTVALRFSASGSCQAYIDESRVLITSNQFGDRVGTLAPFTLIIPDGSTYRFTGNLIQEWWELR